MPELFHFEDFAVGQVFTAGGHRMELARIVAFAEEFDPQPQHTDPQAALGSWFGELVASGWHTAAATMRLNMTGGLPPIAGGTVGAGVDSLAWPKPVRPGDVLSVENEVVALRPSRSRPEKGLISVRSTTRNQRREIVQTLTTTLIVPRRPVPADPD